VSVKHPSESDRRRSCARKRAGASMLPAPYCSGNDAGFVGRGQTKPAQTWRESRYSSVSPFQPQNPGGHGAIGDWFGRAAVGAMAFDPAG